MKKTIQINLIALTLLLAFFNSGVPDARAQSTGFTYQGRLSNSTGFANGVYDLTFNLFNVNSGGSSVAAPVTNSAVAVTNGLFTTTVDFGSAPFANGVNLWLDLAVRTNGAGTFTELTPRQPLTPTPYALVAHSATGLNGSILASQVSGTLAQAQLPANVALLNARQTFTAINSFTGGVGIGTTSPGFLLDVAADLNLPMIRAISSGSDAILALENTGSGGRRYWIDSGSSGAGVGAGNFAVYDPTANASRLVINPSGNVGIGTLTPGDTLEVNGGMRATGATTASSGTGVEIDYGAVPNSGRIFAYDRTGGAYQDMGIGNFAGNHGLLVQAGGNVGIGTVNPQAALDVDGNINVEGALQTQNPGDYIGVYYPGNFDFRMDGENFLSTRSFNLFDITTGTRQNMIAIGGDGSIALGHANRAGGSGSITSGGQFNIVSGDYSTIAGGESNIVSGDYSTIDGGQSNTNLGTSSIIAGGSKNFIAPGIDSVIGGGVGNSISLPIPGVPIGPSEYATIAGGMNNTIDGTSLYGTISGGFGNIVGGGGATAPVIAGGQGNIAEGALCPSIGGGLSNAVYGAYSTIPGGIFNYAAGYCSFAAGANAQALHDGAFVWADSGSPAGNGPNFSSTSANQFSVRCMGGARFVTGIGSSGNPTSGVKLNPGDNSWSSISDRNAKKNFLPVDARAVLEKLAAIPVQTWNYKWEPDETVRNIGPMAQDFKAAFYPGRDDKSISTMEFDGVELAAIQGLNQKLEEQKAENAELKARLEKLEQLVNAKTGEAK